MKKQTGSAFLFSLIVCSLISLLALSSIKILQLDQKLSANQYFSTQAKYGAGVNLFANLVASISQNNQNVFCAQAQSQHAQFSITRSLCLKNNLVTSAQLQAGLIDGNLSNWPLFDYNLFFNNFTTCNLSTNNNFNSSSFSFNLSPSAWVSQNNCLISSTQVANPIIKANLESNQNLQLIDSSNINLIVASGFIDLAGQVELPLNSLIIAAGDLHIHEILNQQSSSANLTLISSSGTIQIDSIQGNFNLKLLAKAGVFLPNGTILNNSNQILPNSIGHEIIGMNF